MPKKSHLHPSDLHGASKLVLQGVAGLTDLVESLHHTITKTPGLLETSTPNKTRGITGLVYRSIRQVTGAVGNTLDFALGSLNRVVGEFHSTPAREASLAALNGVLGDYLAATHNPLAISMRVRCDGIPVNLDALGLKEAFPNATPHLMIVIHGLCMNDLQWRRTWKLGEHYDSETQRIEPGNAALEREPWSMPEKLAQDLSMTPVYIHYNTGLHCSSNGHQLAQLLQDLVSNWPVKVKSVNFLTHSMGGLVSRSAVQHAEIHDMAWRGLVKSMVFLGTPHHGAVLERGGNWIDFVLDASPYTAPFARLGKIRSAGITDLRHGNVLDEDWAGQDRFATRKDTRQTLPLPMKVECFAIAATTGQDLSDPTGKIVGDGLVNIQSALGQHKLAEKDLAFPEAHTWIAKGLNHFDLLGHPAVYDKLKSWLK